MERVQIVSVTQYLSHLSPSNQYFIHIYIYVHVHTYTLSICLYRALEGEKIFEPGNKLQLEPVLFMRSLWGTGER